MQPVVFTTRLTIALSIYLTALLASNTLGIKIMPFVFGTNLSTSIFVFPFVFMMTDVIGEVYGRATARLFVIAGIFSTVLFLGATLLSNIMPTSPDFWAAEGYNQVFGLTFRFTLASLVAFIIGEYQDYFSFFFLRARLGGKLFWLRSNLSNLWGQFLDSAIWFSIAFVGVYPLKTILLMFIPWWLFKFGMGVLYTPLSYLGIALLKSDVNN